MGPIPYFFRFVKQRKRNLPKVSYIEHVLSSLSSLNKKRGTHISGWGKKLKRASQAISWEHHPALLRVALEHDTLSLFTYRNLLNLCTEPILWVSFHSFESPDASHGTHCIVLVHVMFVVVPQCSREVSASRVIHPKYLASKLVSIHVHSICQLHIYVCFMSLMGDTSRPSLDESIPVDFNTLYGN